MWAGVGGGAGGDVGGCSGNGYGGFCGGGTGAKKKGELGWRTHMLAGVNDELALDGPHAVLLVLHTREMSSWPSQGGALPWGRSCAGRS